MDIGKTGISGKLFLAALIAILAAMVLSGCEPYPSRTTRYGGSYQGRGYGPPPPPSCYHNCGVVEDLRQVYVQGDNRNAALGTVIGALVGGALGNQVGKGNGRTAATIGGAVAGGFAGHAIGSRSGGHSG